MTSPLPDLLYLTHRVPFPPDKGDRIRCFHLLEFLRTRARVHLVSLADEPVPPETVAALTPRCHRLEILPLGPLRWASALGSLLRGGTISEGAFSVPALRRLVNHLSREVHFHAALASASSLAPCLLAPGLQRARRVVDLMDVDSQKWLDYAGSRSGPKAWLYGLEGKRLRRLEQQLATWVDGLTLVSENEVRLFRQFCPDAPVHSVTCGVDLDYFTVPSLPPSSPPAGGEDGGRGAAPGTQEIEHSCVFVGALDYLPNIEAAVWFCRQVWPLVRRDYSDARFWVVGRRPAAEVLALRAIPGVEVVGQVPDVRPYLAQAAVAVVPLRIARGIQNKALESMAMAKPTLVSPQTLGGLPAEPGVHLASAETPAEWAATLGELFRDGEKRRRLGEAGRRFVEEHHRWERCLAPFAGMLGLGAGSPHAAGG